MALQYSCSTFDDPYEFIAGDLGINMDKSGKIIHLYNLDKGGDFMLADSATYLIKMRFGGEIMHPESAEFNLGENMIIFYFPGDREVKIKVTQNKKYISYIYSSMFFTIILS